MKLYWFDVDHTVDGQRKVELIYAEDKKWAASLVRMSNKFKGNVVRIISVKLNTEMQRKEEVVFNFMNKINKGNDKYAD